MTPPEAASGRDRDEAGRPRNARPRDATGRPLPRGAAGEPGVPDDLALAPERALEMAQGLLDSGHPFQAHEVLEASWKSAPRADRDLWQGLAQIAVGLTHAQRGNARGASALLRRGAGRLRDYLPPEGEASLPPEGEASPHGVDVRALVTTAGELADRIERDGLGAVTAADLQPRLRTG
jgi:uncharacterized protein